MIPRLTGLRPDWRATLAVLGYAALAATLAQLSYGAVAELMEKTDSIATASDLLDRLQGRRPLGSGMDGAPASAMTGSPFLEGATVTVAGAGLMQRVADAVAGCDGRIASSRVELQGSPLGAGFLGVTASIEIAQSDLQKLLYDLEAGMPFLFIDQLDVQGPTSSADVQDGRMRVLLTVYGQWQGSR